MSHRFVLIALLAVTLSVAAACDDDSTDPSSNPTTLKFTSTLNAANEVPAVTNADSTATGTMNLTINVTRDAAQQITAATGDFTVSVTGFPAGTTLTGTHIHPGAAGGTGGIAVGVTIPTGSSSLTNGTGSFTVTGVSIAADLAQAIISAPANYYFNVHTALNGGGAIRGQLVATQ